MADKTLKTRFLVRRGTSQEFLTPKAIILAEGEPAYITDWNLFVIGNGNDNINDLIAGVRWAQYTENADKLDNHDSAYFVNTATAQTVNGIKTFTSSDIHQAGITLTDGNPSTQSQIIYDKIDECIKFLFK